MMSHANTTDNKVAIETVYQEVLHWRSHKSEYPTRGIPDETWKKIFQLEVIGYTKSELRRFFSLNSHQYDVKRAQFFPQKKTSPTDSNTVESATKQDTPKHNDGAIAFCEVVEAQQAPTNEVPPLTKTAQNNKKAVSQLRSIDPDKESYLDLTTIIVECIHPNGRRLKIHATTKSIDLIMKTFYKYGDFSE